jgi:Tfp pilus assembly protein PilF
MTRARRDVLLFAGALSVRLLHLAAVHDGPLFRYLLIDSAFYDSVGRRLAEGAGFPDGPFFMNVLYGAFLGVVYSAFGAGESGRLAALALQCFVGAASVVLLARLGDRLGRPREGTIAAVGLAVYGPAIFYDGALLTPSLLLALTLVAVLLAHDAGPGRLRNAVALGAVTGLLVLGRANNALLLPAFAAVMLGRGKGAAGSVVLCFVAAALVVLPVTIRNWRESGELVPVSANGGMALWAGNHERATGIYSEPEFLSNPVPESEAEDYRAEASRRAGRELTLAESSAFWTQETWRRWRDEPAWALRLALRKLRFFASATESQTNLSYYFAMEHSPVLAVLRVHLGWILPFAALGLLDLRRLLVPAIPVAVSLLTCVAFYVSSEYRHPVVPSLLLFAATGAVRGARVLRTGTSGAKVLVAAVLLAVLVAANWRDEFLRRLHSMRVDHYNFGTLAADAGELVEAEEFLRRSIAIDPAWVPSRSKLAEVLGKTGRVREAAEETARVAALGAGPPGGEVQRLAEANRLFQAGDFAGAKAVFLAMAAQDEASAAEALNNAGLCAMNLGEAAGAESLFVASAARDPAYASPIVHLGRLALSLGDSASAERRALQALAVAPADERAQRLLRRARGGAD